MTLFLDVISLVPALPYPVLTHLLANTRVMPTVLVIAPVLPSRRVIQVLFAILFFLTTLVDNMSFAVVHLMGFPPLSHSRTSS